ncbi:MAG: hypothetical protein OEM63_11950 [Gammaproteobacteria bacterium]|nr:hypothetical protein [Gammaproteobacteria bacterium]
MNRSPLFYPLNRGMDADAGGAADLQTDVMRFMAIISMCLVAIFALVQSIPLAPVSQTEPVQTPVPAPVIEQPVEIPEKSVTLIRPEAQKLPPKSEPVRLDRPVARPVERPVQKPEIRSSTVAVNIEPVSKPAAPPSSNSDASTIASKAQKGFTLRFESDAALTRLVERDVVGLYAISESSIHRMTIESGAMSFWPASAPQRFHEMDVTTVPEAVLGEWRRGRSGGEIKWGVSIPAPMSRDLNDYLSRHEGGSLVIGRDGQLRMEQ